MLSGLVAVLKVPAGRRLLRPMVLIRLRSATPPLEAGTAGRTQRVLVAVVVRVAVATPVQVPVRERPLRATTVRLAVPLVVVAVETVKREEQTLRAKVAMVPFIGGSRRPLSAMGAVVVRATTTRVYARSAGTTEAATAATMPTTLRPVS